MANHVRNSLLKEPSFKQLHAQDQAGCEQIVTDIARNAKGVWLWVALVTKDLVHAVKTGEQVKKLQEITTNFPRGLDKYFRRMINDIDPNYQVEMAKILLIAIHELQPLPLFAFSLLDREHNDSDYAINASCNPVKDKKDEQLKARVHNRCGDLMVVEDGPHPVFLSQPVDFMHRTVAEYLRDNHERDLQGKLHASFDPMLSLCRIQLFLIKSLDSPDLRAPSYVNQLIGLTDELLYYAHEIELRVDEDQESPATPLLDELDKVNTYHATRCRIKNHWTNLRDDPTPRGNDTYYEGGNCNFLALAVQARLVKYVRAKLEQDPSRINKDGRPLLDYALRPLRRTPIGMPYHSGHDDPSVNVEMVKLLINYDPRAKTTITKTLFSHEDRSVWTLFLLSCNQAVELSDMSVGRRGVPENLKEAWYTACECLIVAGSLSEDLQIPGTKGLDVVNVMRRVFAGKATSLFALMDEQRKTGGSNCVVM